MTIAPTPLHRRHTPSGARLALGAVFVFTLIALVVVLLVHYDAFGDSSSPSAVQGSGVAATQARDLQPFRSIELAGSNNVVVHVGTKQSVVVHADDNLLGHVTTQVQAGRLMIGNTPGSFTSNSPMRVEIGVPSLHALTLTGSGVIVATEIKASRLTVSLPGSGVLRATGSATRLDVDLSGSGDAQLDQVVARTVHAVVSGSGRILIRATNSLDAAVPGSGAVVYRGNPPNVTSNITGTGAVTPG